MKERDIKLLWGRAANRCAICQSPLSQSASSGTYLLGEQAHIVAESNDGPRGASILGLDDRNSYGNMILLCPNHHKEIDKNASDWPVEKLHITKTTHELWVHETLSAREDQYLLAEQIAVTHVIDSAVELCALQYWKSWTKGTLTPIPFWPIGLPDQLFEFLQITHAAIWPTRFDELKRSALTLSSILHDAAQTFMRHSRLEGSMYIADQFYKSRGWNPNYDEDLEAFKNWILACNRKIEMATKAANWFAEIVRRDINPSFFAKHRKFVIIYSDILSEFPLIPEFSDEEKINLPNSLRLADD